MLIRRRLMVEGNRPLVGLQRCRIIREHIPRYTDHPRPSDQVTDLWFLSQGENLGDETRMENVFPTPSIKECIKEEIQEEQRGIDELKRVGNHGNEPQDDAGGGTSRAAGKPNEPSTTVQTGGLI